MSAGFDDEVLASWGQFEARVAEALAQIGEDTFSIDLKGVPAQTPTSPHVQFVGHDDVIRAEVSGSGFRDEPIRMDVDQECALVALGWERPENVDSPNWWYDVAREGAAVVLPMVTATFRQVFGVVHPGFLASERLWPSSSAEEAYAVEEPDGEESTDDCSDVVIGLPDDYDDLVRMVRRSLAHIYGEDVVRDDDGDFPINTGTVPVWVRVEHDKPIVRIFSYVVRSVRDVRQARIEIGILNQRQDLLKFVYADSVITATYDLPAVPFAGPQLMWVLDRIEEQLDGLARDTALRVGGQLWSDSSSSRPTGREEST